MTRDKQTKRDWSEFIEWDQLTEDQQAKVRDVHGDLGENQYANYVWRFSPEDELIGFTKHRCELCGHGPDDLITDCEHEEGETHGPIIDGKCEPCRQGERALRGDKIININARYYLDPILASVPNSFNVIDRALEWGCNIQGRATIFSNGTEAECRDWITRNCEEPAEHTRGDWEIAGLEDEPGRYCKSGQFKIHGTSLGGRRRIANVPYPRSTNPTLDAKEQAEAKANAALIKTSPKLLTLLEQYHEAMPTRESGALIAEAKGWT